VFSLVVAKVDATVSDRGRQSLVVEGGADRGKGGAGRCSHRWLRIAVGVHIWLDQEGKRQKCLN